MGRIRIPSIVEAPTAADVDALADLFAADLQELRHHSEYAALRDTARRLALDDTGRVFIRVARSEAGAVASGVVVAHRWVSAKFGGDAYWLETLHVGEALRRQGIGRRLVEAVIEHARESSAKGIDLEAYRMNAPASYLYRAIGFRRLGRERYSLAL